MGKKKAAAAGADAGAASSSANADPAGPSLVICRNKHWRYISSFHGPWLQLPPEILDSLAHQNYAMPAPRLVDMAVFYDVVKIRKAVDEAAHESVRASTGLSTTAAASSRMDFFGPGGGGGGTPTQLSRERIFKIRQKAVRLLSKAFALDEVAASVATMQATSTVEDVGGHVLKKEPSNQDAKYVHFFHEKIPSRAMEQYTPLDPLAEVISSLPYEQQAPPLRTRALVQIFKQQWDGAALDLTAALRITDELKRTHLPNQQQLELASRMRQERDALNKHHGDWRSIPPLKEEDQPQSLEMQLLFNRAGVYLTLACQSVTAALDGLKEFQAAEQKGEVNGEYTKTQTARLDAKKRLKTYAKRALKDYTAFLANFDYTPGLPVQITNEIMRRIHHLANGNKTQSSTSRNRLIELHSDEEECTASDKIAGDPSSSAVVKHQRARAEHPERSEDGWPRFVSPTIYPASALFAEKPPPDLPQFPSEQTATAMLNNETINEAFGSREAVTYHPLLTDALHSLLLTHALLQTSPTELLRHAHNAARLARIADGYPIFQAARSPARADWIEVLRRANNWLGLAVPWQRLCAPAPLSDPNSSRSGRAGNNHAGAGLATKLGDAKAESAEQKRERIKQESIIDALSDDRVVDEESFRRAVRARELRAMEDEQGISSPLKDKDPAATTTTTTTTSSSALPTPSSHPRAPDSPATSSSSPSSASSTASGSDETNGGTGSSSSRTTSASTTTTTPQRWAQEPDGREYPISTDRAEAIARWIKEAPLSTSAGGGSSGTGGSSSKKKRPARKKKPAAAQTTSNNDDAGAAVGVAALRLGDPEDRPD